MILLTYGTRPEYIKIKPLMKEMRKQKISFKVLFTGQHKDYDYGADFRINFITYGNNRLDNIIQNCLNLPDEWFYNIKYILVQGDTTSVLGLSIMSMHRNIKVIHLEAGLRTHDLENPYPEEYNRILAAKIANIHLCPTEINRTNLIQENVNPNNIFVVGNTSLDNLVDYLDKCEYGNKILVTLHRRENLTILKEWFIEINKLAHKYNNLEFILPIHPNPEIRKQLPKKIKFTVKEPLTHDELLDLLVECRLVITDSGGLQEECSFFNKKCLICRKTTERVEVIGTSSFLVKEPKDLSKQFDYHIKNYKIKYESVYGNGTSSKSVCNILKLFIDTIKI